MGYKIEKIKKSEEKKKEKKKKMVKAANANHEGRELERRLPWQFQL